MRFVKGAERFHTASYISDTHRTGKCVAVNFAERLNLHGTGKRDQRVGDQIEASRDKTNRKKQCYFNDQYDLSPVDDLEILKGLSDKCGSCNTERKK